MLIEKETQNKKGVRDRLERKIASMHLNLPKEILQDFIAVSEILTTSPKESLGKMIVVTGLDKSGKETQAFNPERNPKITSIYDYLLSKSYTVLKISLPSYKSTFGSLVAAYLGKEEVSVQILGKLPTEVAWILWSLDRAQHNLAIQKWLRQSSSHIVLSKRWTETNIAYQTPLGIDEKRILSFERNILKQDYTLVIDVTPKVAMKRMTDSKEEPDRYETFDFLVEVNERYGNLEQYYPFGRIFHVNGCQQIKKVNKALLEVLSSLGF